jgi:hypothetical protein
MKNDQWSKLCRIVKGSEENEWVYGEIQARVEFKLFAERKPYARDACWPMICEIN